MNLQPPGYEPDELPFALPRDVILSVAGTLPTQTVKRDLIGAGDRGRTGTIGKDRGILSPVRLPIPPLRQKIPQAAYSSLRNGEIGSGGETRTHNLAVNSRLLRH